MILAGLVTITPGPTPPPRPSETPNLENTLSQVVVTTTSAPVNNPGKKETEIPEYQKLTHFEYFS